MLDNPLMPKAVHDLDDFIEHGQETFVLAQARVEKVDEGLEAWDKRMNQLVEGEDKLIGARLNPVRITFKVAARRR